MGLNTAAYPVTWRTCMARGRISNAVRGLAVISAVGVLAAVPMTVQAQENSVVRPTALAVERDQAVTLVTGERVFLATDAAGRAVRSVEPLTTAPSNEPARVRTMAVGNHYYVVP